MNRFLSSIARKGTRLSAPALGGWLAAAAVLLLATAAELEADDVQKLRVLNSTERWVTFQIMSRNSHNPSNPWVTRSIRPESTTSIDLASPDKFIVRVRLSGIWYRSAPMPLKSALAKNPDRVLDVMTLAGADPRTRMDYGISLSLRSRSDPYGPRDASDDPALHQEINNPRLRTGSPAGRAPAGNSGAAAPRPASPKLGISCRKTGEGIRIDSVDADGPAANCRDRNGNEIYLEAGDHIVKVNGVAPTSFEHYLELLKQSPKTVQIVAKDHRSGRLLYLSTDLW